MTALRDPYHPDYPDYGPTVAAGYPPTAHASSSPGAGMISAAAAAAQAAAMQSDPDLIKSEAYSKYAMGGGSGSPGLSAQHSLSSLGSLSASAGHGPPPGSSSAAAAAAAAYYGGYGQGGHLPPPSPVDYKSHMGHTTVGITFEIRRHWLLIKPTVNWHLTSPSKQRPLVKTRMESHSFSEGP